MFSLYLLAVVATCSAVGIQYYSGVWTFVVPGVCAAPRDCQEIYLRPTPWLDILDDGCYALCPGGLQSGPQVNVPCDMQGEGWTILLKRFDGSVGFRGATWNQMKKLIGSCGGEYWFGLEDIHRLTSSGNYSVMVEIYEGSNYWTEIYNSFYLSGEAQKYTLRVEGFDSVQSTNKDAALGLHNNLPFSTRDRDNNACAANGEAPGWFNSNCRGSAHPFGLYGPSQPGGLQRMQWRVDGRDIYPIGLTIKIKRIGVVQPRPA